jgi:hypothetical protein
MSLHVVVDGSNIATESRSLPSLKQLNEAVLEFMAEHPDADITVVVDASFGHRIDESERAEFEAAEDAHELVSPPAGAIGRGDAFVLRIAEKTGAVVLSNDSFQEFHAEHEWLFDEGRLIGGKPVPGVGWIFTARTPVRGPKSREVTKDAKRRRAKTSVTAAAPLVSGDELLEKGRAALGRLKRPRKQEKTVERAIAAATEEAVTPASEASGRKRRRKTSAPPADPVNDPMTFINFVAVHKPGSEVEGEVESFSSHGAFVDVDGVRCYVPLSLMADPAPRAARDVLTKGERRQFVIRAFDAPRRGIELALPGMAEAAGAPTDETVAAETGDDEREVEPARAGRRRSPTKRAAAVTDAEPVVTLPDLARATMAAAVSGPASGGPRADHEPAGEPTRSGRRRSASKQAAPATEVPEPELAAVAASTGGPPGHGSDGPDAPAERTGRRRSAPKRAAATAEGGPAAAEPVTAAPVDGGAAAVAKRSGRRRPGTKATASGPTGGEPAVVPAPPAGAPAPPAAGPDEGAAPPIAPPRSARTRKAAAGTTAEGPAPAANERPPATKAAGRRGRSRAAGADTAPEIAAPAATEAATASGGAAAARSTGVTPPAPLPEDRATPSAATTTKPPAARTRASRSAAAPTPAAPIPAHAAAGLAKGSTRASKSAPATPHGGPAPAPTSAAGATAAKSASQPGAKKATAKATTAKATTAKATTAKATAKATTTKAPAKAPAKATAAKASAKATAKASAKKASAAKKAAKSPAAKSTAATKPATSSAKHAGGKAAPAKKSAGRGAPAGE